MNSKSKLYTGVQIANMCACGLAAGIANGTSVWLWQPNGTFKGRRFHSIFPINEFEGEMWYPYNDVRGGV